MVSTEVEGLWEEATQASGNVLLFAYKNRGKPRKCSTKIIVVLTEI